MPFTHGNLPYTHLLPKIVRDALHLLSIQINIVQPSQSMKYVFSKTDENLVVFFFIIQTNHILHRMWFFFAY